MENPESQSAPRKKDTPIAASIVVAGFLVAGAILASSLRQESLPTPEVSGSGGVEDVSDSDFIAGNPDAPITLVEYADFSCSFCARYHPVMHRIVREYDGEVRWVYRHLPIFNKPAAVASECVGRALGDEVFFDYADRLYARQSELGNEVLRSEALAVGMKAEDYDACVDDPAVNDEIARDFTRVRILAGFNATPYTVLIDKDGNRYPFSGALPYEDVSSLIDSLR